MKRVLVLKFTRLYLLACLLALTGELQAQRNNVFYVEQFKGSTVAAKVTAAQASCNANTNVPCVIVFDPTLANYPAGSLPSRCTQCIWQDYRALPPALDALGNVHGAASSTDGNVAVFSGTSGVSLKDGGVLLSSLNPYTGFKNRLINGDMRIDQRYAGNSVTASSGIYPLDRWITVVAQSSKYQMQQNLGSVAPPAGFTNYLGVKSLSAYTALATDYFLIEQRIEGLNTADLAWGTTNAQAVTLSFWVYSSLTGAFGGVVRNSAENYSYPFSYTIAVANTWQKVAITVPGPTTGTWLTNSSIGIKVMFSLSMGSNYVCAPAVWVVSTCGTSTGATNVLATNNATWNLTGVQFESGSQATAFERRAYGSELLLAQRYYYRRSSASTADPIAMMQAESTTGVFGKLFDLPVTMRGNPTVGLSSATHITPFSAVGVALSAFATATNLVGNQRSIFVWGSLDGSSGIVAGNAVMITFNTASGWIDASSEL